MKKLFVSILLLCIFISTEVYAKENFFDEAKSKYGHDKEEQEEGKDDERCIIEDWDCKKFENKEGYLTSAFFKNILSKKAQFISGPFTSMMFEIIERQKNKLKILLGNIVTTISDKNNYLYRPIWKKINLCD